MSAQQQTLELIRSITSDGVVSFAELTNLATFLNENREARKAWPGTAVFDVLKDILRDGRVDPHELAGLNLILEGVEIICAGRSAATAAPPAQPAEAPKPAVETAPAPAAVQEEPDVGSESVILNLPTATDLTLPSLLTDDIVHDYEGVHIPSYRCDCEDWKKNREAFPESSPARVCRCMASALVHELDENPKLNRDGAPILEEVLRAAHQSGRGLEAVSKWKSVQIGNRHFVISVGKTAWCNVYALNLDNAFQKFSYHREFKRWGFGDQPKDDKILIDFFKDGFARIFG
jgi:hypothetical protein